MELSELFVIVKLISKFHPWTVCSHW